MESIREIVIQKLPFVERESTKLALYQTINREIERAKINCSHVEAIELWQNPKHKGTCIAFVTLADPTQHASFVEYFNGQLNYGDNTLKMELSRNLSRAYNYKEKNAPYKRATIQSSPQIDPSAPSNNKSSQLNDHSPQNTSEKISSSILIDQQANEINLPISKPTEQDSAQQQKNSPAPKSSQKYSSLKQPSESEHKQTRFSDPIAEIKFFEKGEGKRVPCTRKFELNNITLDEESASYEKLTVEQIHGPCVPLNEYNKLQTTFKGLLTKFAQLEVESNRRGEHITQLEKKYDELSVKHNELKDTYSISATMNGNYEQALGEYRRGEKESQAKILALQVDNESLSERLKAIKQAFKNF